MDSEDDITYETRDSYEERQIEELSARMLEALQGDLDQEEKEEELCELMHEFLRLCRG